MAQIISATFQDGVFRPDGPLDLSPGMRVRLTVEPENQAPESVHGACEELDNLCAESPINSGGSRLTREQLHDRR